MQLGYILMRAELDAVICSGALRGKLQTYALLDDRVPPAGPLARDEALAELTRRYFASRGPATLKDFTGWSSLTAADGRNGLAMIRSQLEHVATGDRTWWFAPSALDAAPASPVIDLVQGYDEIVMSYSESKDVLLGPGAASASPGEPACHHAVLLDGQLIGHWRHVIEKGSVRVETQLSRPVDGAEAHALEAAVERYGRFLGLPAHLRQRG